MKEIKTNKFKVLRLYVFGISLILELKLPPKIEVYRDWFWKAPFIKTYIDKGNWKNSYYIKTSLKEKYNLLIDKIKEDNIRIRITEEIEFIGGEQLKETPFEIENNLQVCKILVTNEYNPYLHILPSYKIEPCVFTEEDEKALLR